MGVHWMSAARDEASFRCARTNFRFEKPEVDKNGCYCQSKKLMSFGRATQREHEGCVGSGLLRV